MPAHAARRHLATGPLAALAAAMTLLVAFIAHAQPAPKRLSDWLLEQAPTANANAYPLGLSWRVPQEIPAQNAILLDLVRSLSGQDAGMKADPASAARLRDWLRTLPVTGRVPVRQADARWLQGNPLHDPFILPGHSVVLPRRPKTVTVITYRGTRCVVEHSSGHEARAYVEACSPSGVRRTDWVWIAQPDGRVQRFGVAGWNQELQGEPAPGAWIWGPPRDGGWPERMGERLMAFLAMQGPAPDPGGPVQARLPEIQSTVKETVPSTIAGGASSPLALSRVPALAARQDADEAPEAETPSGQPQPLGAPAAPSRGLQVSSSDWGGVGLMQTPSARMNPAGHLSFHLSRTYPYTHGNVIVQPFDWLEAGFRYTNISNIAYGTTALSGDQAYKDKSFDAKFKLTDESAYIPQLSVGIRDLTGTGLFAGEYLVGNKRTGSFDWSLGLGWGYVGGRADIRNPLGRLWSKFDTRTTSVGQGGSLAFSSYFRGPTSLFGGVQWQSPWESLVFKLEYDGNGYQREPQGNNQPQGSPWNVGVVYRLGRAMDISFGVERGNTAMLGITLHTQLDGLSFPKSSDPPRIPVAATRPRQTPDWSATSSEIARQTQWHVGRIEQQGREVRVTVDDVAAMYWRERIERAASVLHRDAPDSVDRFTLTYRQQGVDVAEHVIDRDAWVAERTRPVPPTEQREAVYARAPVKAGTDGVLYADERKPYEAELGGYFQHTLGGPDGFILYQVGAAERFKWRFRPDTWLQGTVHLALVDNYDKFKYTAPSNLPRVRTFLREYLTTSPVMVPNLQLTHVGKLSENQYYSVYGGALEAMFSGVGAEWMYRPFGSRVAIGVDANAVQQRGFRQDFEMRDYKVATGHATLYWDTGWNKVQANLSVGRYLAKDYGATVDLSKIFDNGVRMGAFFTKTNVSSAQFGEGSFDKGVYLSIPFDAFLTRSTSSIGHIVWKPLTRDGGAKLGRSVQLYDVTTARDDRTLRYRAAPTPNDAAQPDERREPWTPTPKGPAPYTRMIEKPLAERWVSDTRYEQRLYDALYRQEFRNIRIAFDASYRLTVSASNEYLRPISRAVGRAARTALRLAPLDTREIRIAFDEGPAPAAVYDFVDLARLERFFAGELKRADIEDRVAVEYRNPSAREADPLARLADLKEEAEPRTIVDVVLPDPRTVNRVVSDVSNAARAAQATNWWQLGALGTGLVLASSIIDRRADTFATNNASKNWMTKGVKIGNAIPWVAMGGAALAALDGTDPVLSRTGYAAVEAGGAAFLAATGLKYVVGRQRPGTGVTPGSFDMFSGKSNYDALPSRHSAVAWAAVTPFAIEYHAPWLYGIAAATNLSRVGSREHWFSDTVAGGLIGYGIGRLFYESARAPQKKGMPRVMLNPTGVNFAWELE